MSDLGSHWNDLPFWALKLEAPLTIEASGPPPHAEMAPASMHATYDYGARGDAATGEAHLVPGRGEAGAVDARAGSRNGRAACCSSAARGCCSPTTAGIALLPEASFKDFQRPAPFDPDSIGHHAGMDARLQDRRADDLQLRLRGPLTEANHLGNVAYRVGQEAGLGPREHEVPERPEAENFLRREYRKGWKLG